MLNENVKQWIDNATYEELLHLWRFAPIGDPLFRGETGDYYSNVMAEKRKTADHVNASKKIGW